MLISELPLNRQLWQACEEAGFTEATEIQEKAIPQILAGHDILGIAQTGTGKTAAFVLPLLFKLKYPQIDTPRGLILAPTRELVVQITQHFEKLAIHTGLRVVALFGGTGMKNQQQMLAAGCDVVVSTPGRLLDLYLDGSLKLKALQYFVIDEADRMMDMGFMPQIRRILEIIPLKRQNLLFSATFPEKVEKLSAEFLEFPLKVEVAPQASVIETIDQKLFFIPNRQTKLALILHIITQPDFSNGFVFCRTRSVAEDVAKFLIRRQTQHKVLIIHANKGQNTRLNALEAFRKGEGSILVTTDVSARGLDIPEVSHVINFDVPILYEDYVHRIGRTGRAGKIGTGITMMTKADEWHIKKIEKLIRKPIPVVPIPAEVPIYETPFQEEQELLREIDNQRKKDDPNFQGAFHEKKNVPTINKKGKPTSKPKADQKSKKPNPKGGNLSVSFTQVKPKKK